jgi:hypothetical protein
MAMTLGARGNFQVTISMGVAEYPPTGATRRADRARRPGAVPLQASHGRNCVLRWSRTRNTGERPAA